MTFTFGAACLHSTFCIQSPGLLFSFMLFVMPEYDAEKQPATAESFPDLTDPQVDAVDSSQLSRRLSPRQVQMIAIGGTIGTGLYLGTGRALATGGPASMLLAYAICGAIVLVTMLSLGEMVAFIPVTGSFCTFAG